MVATVHATEEGRHGGIHGDTSKYIHEQEYWLTYEAWRIIVFSQFMKQEVMRSFNAPADKVDVIFNGVEPGKFQFAWSEKERSQLRADLATPDEQIVMYVGRFVREKGIQVLLNAASVILSQRPNVKFLIVGGGHRERFERFVHWSGLESKVLFTGFMANRSLHQLYRVADVAVFPSLYEPFGIVALEGMAAGVPVVASDAGGLREVVQHDQTGTLSYANDAQSLAWAVLKVLADPERARRLASNAAKRLSTDFNWSVLAAQTLQVYQRVWAEFLQSYWATRTLWPVTEGAEDRAAQLKVREKAVAGAVVQRPRPMVNVGGPVKPKAFEDEEEERTP